MRIKKSLFWIYLVASLFLYSSMIDCETLTLTTYYPAPYGGYVRMLTTDTTILARDGGSVGIGTSTPWAKLDVADNNGGRISLNPFDGGIEVASGNDETSYIDFKGRSGLGSDYQGRIIHTNGVGFGIYGGDVRVGSNLRVDGSILGVCTVRYYGTGGNTACPSGTSVMGHFGDGRAKFIRYFYDARGFWSAVVMGYDWAGWMYCCRIRQ